VEDCEEEEKGGGATMGEIFIEPDLRLDDCKVTLNPDDQWYAEFLRPYYALTRDGQYLFASRQLGRIPSCAFYMVPSGYRLGKKQSCFEPGHEVGHRLFDVIKRYLTTVPVIVVEGIQGEADFEVGLKVVMSIRNPHSAYMTWMGKLMVFPYRPEVPVRCWNYIVPESLPAEVVAEIRSFCPEFREEEPLTLYDLTEKDGDIRRVLSLGIDYFGGAFKKPNLTMVWNRAEEQGMVSYHAGCTSKRILKGLSGTGKTTLTVGSELEQDDACVGKPYYNSHGRVAKTQIIGLEAASFAKSEGLTPDSPEWPGLMKSRKMGEDGKRPVVLALNIDCQGAEHRTERIAGYEVRVPCPVPGDTIGSLQCTRYEKSGTTNGRFVFPFTALNAHWGCNSVKWLKAELLTFKRFDIVEPLFRVVDPDMAVALDSAYESVITSALADRKPGTRVRSYAATDFMAREQSEQALLKWKMYADLGLGMEGKLLFCVVNSGFVGELDLEGNQILVYDEEGQPIPLVDALTGEIARDERGHIRYQGQGEKINVQDSKRLVDLVEHRQIERWLTHPVYGYLIPDPQELEEVHGLVHFRRRFNPLRFYSPQEIVAFFQRDIAERTEYLRQLFRGQRGEEKLQPVIEVWQKCSIPAPEQIQVFYEEHYHYNV